MMHRCLRRLMLLGTVNKMVSAFGRMSGPTPELASLTFQCIAVGHRFEFHANGVGDGDDGASFEREGRQHRTELMHFERVVTFHQHIPAPITNADDERFDVEIGGRFPGLKTSRIRFCAFSYSMGVPCGRSFQVIMYFMIFLLSRIL